MTADDDEYVHFLRGACLRGVGCPQSANRQQEDGEEAAVDKSLEQRIPGFFEKVGGRV